MAAAIVTIICIAMIVVGGMTLSQGILTTADSTAISVDTISVREGEMMRTNLEITRAAQLSWGTGNYMRLTVKNSGQTKLANYNKWDLIISYEDGGSTLYSTWLPYTTTAPGNNEWQKARIGLNGPLEYFEPDIINPGEEMVILAYLNPLPGSDTTGDISLTTPNGIYDTATFVNPGYLRLTPESETISLSGTKYYELAEAETADGNAITAGAEFASGEPGRKLLYNTAESNRPAKFVYPLTGIDEIPADEWTVNYHCRVYADSAVFPQSDNDTGFNVDVLVRQADGTIRDTIGTSKAAANFAAADAGTWVTIIGTYSFPGYTVTDQDDYIEIDFYGWTSTGPDANTGYMQIIFDDYDLPVNEQTRIEA